MSLIKCSECDQQVSSNATACPGCGNPIKKRKNKSSGFLGKLTLIFVAIAFVSMFSNREKQTPEQVMQAICDNPVAAYRYTKNFVKVILKSPSTAKFPDYSSSFVKPSGQCSYYINSYVDSQNGFGAMLRKSFSIEVKFDKSADKWLVLEQNIIR